MYVSIQVSYYKKWKTDWSVLFMHADINYDKQYKEDDDQKKSQVSKIDVSFYTWEIEQGNRN